MKMFEKLPKKRVLIIAGAVLALAVGVVAIVSVNLKGPNGLNFLPIPSQELPEVKIELPEKPYYPLTGLPADNHDLMLARPLSVKIENTPDARPQLGISNADVVYETITEAGITRFNCIFQSTIPGEVGPVRSGRNSDISIVPQYNALFFMSGSNDLVLSQVANAGLADMSYTAAPEIYHRIDYRQAPHNLYLNLSEAYGQAAQMGYTTSLDRLRSFEFVSGPAAEYAAAGAGKTGQDGKGTNNGGGASGGASGSTNGSANAPNAATITVPFSSSYVAEWLWDANDKLYYRSMDGQSTDAQSGQAISATNLIVLWAAYIPVLDGQTSEVDLADSGEASLFIGGKRYDGIWESDGSNPPRFKDADGNAIKLTPGKTWFQVLNTGQGITAG